MNKDQINELFFYKEGKLFWKKSGTGRNLLQDAGYTNQQGYKCIFINKKLLKTHRLIYILHYGNIPNGLQIDHIDRDKNNNKIENLRLATQQENNRNRSCLGIIWSERHKKWRAKIYVDRKYICLKYHLTIIDARAAYLKARKNLFKEFA